MRERAFFLAVLLAVALLGMKYFSRPPAAQGIPVGAPKAKDRLLPKGLELSDISVLARWMTDDPGASAAPPRNPFRYAPAPVQTFVPPAPIPAAKPIPVAPPEPVDGVRLTGLIVRRRDGGATETVAVLRIGGEVFLAARGEIAGAYRVEEIVGQEEVHLVETATGVRRVLKILE